MSARSGKSGNKSCLREAYLRTKSENGWVVPVGRLFGNLVCDDIYWVISVEKLPSGRVSCIRTLCSDIVSGSKQIFAFKTEFCYRIEQLSLTGANNDGHIVSNDKHRDNNNNG